MLRCPVCGKATIRQWQKLIAGGLTNIPCPVCGSRLGMPHYDFAVYLALILWYYWAKPGMLIVWILYLAYMLARQLFIPFVVREKGTPPPAAS